MFERPPRIPITLDDLHQAVVFDIETICNCFSIHVQPLFGDWEATFEISEFRDDRRELLAWFEHWRAHRVPMISFNGLAFDYPILHFIWQNPGCTVWDIYEKAQEQIHDRTMFKMVWESERFAPQIDLLKLWHFDNKARMTSLKALEINMRSETVMEMPLPFDEPIAAWNVDSVLIPYNRHDVKETKRFALISLDAIKFRIELQDILDGDVLNWSDSKIGSKILEQRLGDDVCYEWVDGRRQKRQTRRHRVAFSEIIFPYIRFDHPEFNRVLDWMRGQAITEDEITGKLKTKGVFTDVCATVGGFDFHFGMGGIHGCVPAQIVRADAETMIRDIDVAGLYPAIAIVNRLYPEHLGERFVFEYAQLPVERAKYKKGTPRSNAFKLAANGTYGNSNSEHSIFYDTRLTMAITINGQFLLCMLAEWLLTVPTVRLLQANTDGITYTIRRDMLPRAVEIEAAWQAYTRLVLEDVEYSAMWIGDVNNYVAQATSGKLKLKGRFWYPVNFPDDISNASPPAWHKDLSALITIKAAVDHMTRGVPIAQTIHECDDPHLFMLREKIKRSDKLYIGDTEVQRTLRYYIARDGAPLRKVMPPKGPAGHYKRKNGIGDSLYYSVLQTLPPDTHDPRIHTANKSRYEIREQGLQAGYLVADCCRASDFDWNRVNYDWYEKEAEKLVIR
ncbi:hypothetical protein ACQR1I_36665 [Bradyrhizobium sp. HKCCYLS2038]|uniref:hypothetical protein n=1 Tax=Bradyrhizobium sp. HKCCYLS2038 TaxID=3420764 RepID=UPI003EBD7F67